MDYFLAGSVFVRAGQVLSSAGTGPCTIKGDLASPTVNVLAGAGFIGGSVVSDAGSTGTPVTVKNLFFSQGSVSAGCLKAQFVGFIFSDLFLSNCGTGMEIEAGDGVISNIVFDLGLTHLYIHDSQNVVFNNIISYNPNYSIIIGSNVYDIQFNNTHLEYFKYAGVYFNDSSVSIRNVRFDGFQAITNIQYATILAQVYMRTGDFEAVFTNCAFRNMFNYAVVSALGTGGRLAFRNCHFDGLKTNPAYNQSATAGGIYADGLVLDLTDVDFRNMAVNSILLEGSRVSSLRWTGGKIEASTPTIPVSLTNTNPNTIVHLASLDGGGYTLYTPQATIPVKHVAPLTNWFAAVIDSGTRFYWRLPYKIATVYELTVIANPLPAGGGYTTSSTYQVRKSNSDSTVSGTPTSWITFTLVSRDPAVGAVPVLDVQAEFDAVGAGVSVAPPDNTGFIVISIPNTYTSAQLEAVQLANQ